MQLLLKAAKLAALCEGDTEIRLAHLARVLPYLHPVEAGLEQWLARRLGPSEEPPLRLTNTLIRQAGEEPALPWSKEVTQLISELASKGYSIRDLCFLTEEDVVSRKTPNPLRSFITTFSPARTAVDQPEVSKKSGSDREHTPSAISKEAVESARPASASFISRRMDEIKQLENSLNEAVKGQETAIRLFADELRYRVLGNANGSVVNAFFLIGPSNTGKSLFTDVLAQEQHGRALKTFNMSQYDSANEGFGLTGLRKGYTDAREGTLTGFAATHPDGIIVFDNIDQAHRGVQAQLIELLATGKIEDAYTEEIVSFKRNLIFLTSRGSRSFFASATQTALIETNAPIAAATLLDAMLEEAKSRQQLSEFAKGLTQDLYEAATALPVLIFRKLDFTAMAKILADDLKALQEDIKRHFGAVLVAKPEKAAEMWLARSAPGFDLKEARANLSRDLLGLFMSSHEALSNVQLTMSPEFDLQTVAVRNGFEYESLGNFLGHLKRQSRSLSFKLETSGGAAPILQAAHCKFNKLGAAEDFEGNIGLSACIPDVTFQDIAGHNAVKSRLTSLIEILSGGDASTRKIELPKGIILHGPPGTGKTMLAKATANHAGLPFIPVTGNDLLDQDNILRVFELAREYAPSLVFIDEIDAIPKRGEAGHKVDWVINRLLTEIDGFRTRDEDKVLIMAATNRLQTLDPALVRSGRLELHVHIGHLDKGARRWFLTSIIEELPCSADVDLEKLVAMTVGMTGADINRLKREALFRIAQSKIESIDNGWLANLVRELKYGKPVGNKQIPELLRESAVHQAAKAVVSKILLPSKDIDFVSIIARERQQAGVSFTNNDSFELTAEVMMAQTATFLAGRIAQTKAFGERGVDEAAEPDFIAATELAYQAIGRFGMGEGLPPIHWPALNRLTDTSQLPEQILAALGSWLERASELATQTLEAHWHMVVSVSDALEQQEVLDKGALQNLTTT
ncbi:hypothetical protein Q667_15890 [Marinobacter sp. C1S70]|uniref:AAA family ATPase n=1 Tax=Marinobacter sp. C1S70 TaxID=1396859 RepID=UPI0003B819BD|nr:AAA family ATPase [Marinobacter sp. C1S70]ERS86890.1 hypothetical protein Q667_15890 [Marinobacter sp. C1S70]